MAGLHRLYACETDTAVKHDTHQPARALSTGDRRLPRAAGVQDSADRLPGRDEVQPLPRLLCMTVIPVPRAYDTNLRNATRLLSGNVFVPTATR